MSKTLTEKQVIEIYNKAVISGKNAVNELIAKNQVQPMIVHDSVNKKDYFVSDGLCGFASVNIKPANCKFAKFLINQKLAYKSDYYGGVSYSISDYNQSYQKKCSFASGFSKILTENNIRNYVQSRLD